MMPVKNACPTNRNQRRQHYRFLNKTPCNGTAHGGKVNYSRKPADVIRPRRARGRARVVDKILMHPSATWCLNLGGSLAIAKDDVSCLIAGIVQLFVSFYVPLCARLPFDYSHRTIKSAS